MSDFKYSPVLGAVPDLTDYRFIGSEGVNEFKIGPRFFLEIDEKTISDLSEKAFSDVNHFLRASHLAQLRKILDDGDSTMNEKYVALELLKNAVISSGGVFPLCQDTGTAIVMAKKGQGVLTSGCDEKSISRGIFEAYKNNNLRYSQVAPISMFDEKNTGTNLPAQIDIYSGDELKYEFLFMAKGGGSANKTFLFQETKALLDPEKITNFLAAKMRDIGTSACPPYHMAIVIGGMSAEFNLKTVKLATAGCLDYLPCSGNILGIAFRDKELEEKLLEISKNMGIGAQFGGKYFCHDIRVIRLPRHGASCPVGIGVSCSADRQIKAKITSEGVFLENLETDPSLYLPVPEPEITGSVHINLNKPMDDIRSHLSGFPVSTRLLLSGKMVVARDIAHAKIMELLKNGHEMPDYMKKYPVYYAGPAKTPKGHASGSFGPTTAGRMDSYVAEFQKRGGSLVMVAKGNRGRQVRDACKEFGGFYLGSIGGPAARLGRDCITKAELIEFPELGMEAVYLIEIKDFPAFIIMDDKGNDFYDSTMV
ncbi:FumA C-terminus/TtdB family hydratase beta subunit [Desulforegula conservatrix]|uniref:FumA C-terminus/TtdB family hydratase beta subunit n=1 Tax=Desulforegula conservatrix TaxID=153026 RepID=UPI000487E06B|nr:FumA C-terminus/TtdB family hydratase beta subunit [Desulforegula conservatrix]